MTIQLLNDCYLYRMKLKTAGCSSIRGIVRE
jgi:hypothetical protein